MLVLVLVLPLVVVVVGCAALPLPRPVRLLQLLLLLLQLLLLGPALAVHAPAPPLHALAHVQRQARVASLKCAFKPQVRIQNRFKIQAAWHRPGRTRQPTRHVLVTAASAVTDVRGGGLIGTTSRHSFHRRRALPKAWCCR